MLLIEHSVLNEMVFNVEYSSDERCGFLIGYDDHENRRVITSRPVTNAYKGSQQRNFEITSKDYLLAEQFAARKGLQLLGIYHSHPNQKALPSQYDEVAAQPYFSYLIFSTMHGKLAEMRSWRLNDQSVFEEEQINLYPIHYHGNSNHTHTLAEIHQ